jgi:hypothetical protein
MSLNFPNSPSIDQTFTGNAKGTIWKWDGYVWDLYSISSSDVKISGYVANSETGAFYPASNPSGFITGVNLSSYVTNSQTGAFYPASNPSGYVSSTQTGAFYAASNPSGYIGSAGLANVVSITGTQTISGSKIFIAPPLETKATPTISAGALTLDLSSASLFYVTLNSAVTITLTNIPTSPRVHSFTLQFVGDSTARTVTWPTNTRWAGGTPPTPTSALNKVDTFTFLTHDGGSNWFAFVSNQNQ